MFMYKQFAEVSWVYNNNKMPSSLIVFSKGSFIKILCSVCFLHLQPCCLLFFPLLFIYISVTISYLHCLVISSTLGNARLVLYAVETMWGKTQY